MLMEHKARQQARRCPASLSALHDDAGSLLSLLWEEGENRDAAEPAVEQTENLAHTIGTMNQSELPSRYGESREEAHPGSQTLGAHDMGCGARPIRSGAHRPFAMKRWIGHDLVVAFAQEASFAERLGRHGYIGIDHSHPVAEAISSSVLLGEGAKFGIDLDCRYL